ADIFEVRGMTVDVHGELEPPVIKPDAVELGHRGRDGGPRRRGIGFAGRPDELFERGGMVYAVFRLHLGPYQTRLVGMTVDTLIGEEPGAPLEFDVAVHELRRSYEDWERESTQVVTDNELFNQLLERSLRDVRALS